MDQIISSYLNGTATSDQTEQLLAWLRESPTNFLECAQSGAASQSGLTALFPGGMTEVA